MGPADFEPYIYVDPLLFAATNNILLTNHPITNFSENCLATCNADPSCKLKMDTDHTDHSFGTLFKHIAYEMLHLLTLVCELKYHAPNLGCLPGESHRFDLLPTLFPCAIRFYRQPFGPLFLGLNVKQIPQRWSVTAKTRVKQVKPVRGMSILSHSRTKIKNEAPGR